MSGGLRTLRDALRRVPTTAWICAAIAAANAACWATVTPPFWVPDEPAHAGYVQHLAETGGPPKPAPYKPSEEQSALAGGLQFNVEGRPPWLEQEAEESRQALDSANLGRVEEGQAYGAVNYPPLYYAYEALPYLVFYGASFDDRLYAMRLFSALLAGLTALFTFLFIRELIPRTPWVWTIGALAVAFQPLLGFLSGGVNNDVLILTASAALLFGLARAFRRGLSPATGAVIGLALAVGLLTKPTILGLVPGTALGLLVLVWRGPRGRRTALLGATAATFLAVVPFGAWFVAEKTLLEREGAPTSGIATSTASQSGSQFVDLLGYLWQSVLPRLPFMNDQFSYYAPWEIYFKGFIGRFGWFEFGFSAAWNIVALAVFAMIAVFVALGLRAHWASFRRRWPELVVYLSLAGGVLLATEVAAYRYHLATDQYAEQTRYLMPLLGLYGALIAVAALGAGPRYGRAVGALLVVLAMGHSLFSQLLTVARFYT